MDSLSYTSSWPLATLRGAGSRNVLTFRPSALINWDSKMEHYCTTECEGNEGDDSQPTLEHSLCLSAFCQSHCMAGQCDCCLAARRIGVLSLQALIKGISVRSGVHVGNWTGSLAEKLRSYWRHGPLEDQPPFTSHRRFEAPTYALLPLQDRYAIHKIVTPKDCS